MDFKDFKDLKHVRDLKDFKDLKHVRDLRGFWDFWANILDKKQADTNNTDYSAQHFAQGNSLMEQPCGGGDDEDRCEGEDGLRDAGGGVLRGHQRKADAHKGAEKHGEEGTTERLAVTKGLSQLARTLFGEEQQQKQETHQTYSAPYHGGSKWDAEAQR